MAKKKTTDDAKAKSKEKEQGKTQQKDDEANKAPAPADTESTAEPEEAKTYPDLMFYATTNARGIYLNGSFIRFRAGQEINDQGLMRTLEQQGVEIVDSLSKVKR